MVKNTKIVATIGPASNSVKTLKQLIKAGLNVARVNASHGDHKQHQELIKNIREAEAATKSTIGILYDLQGPKIRIGNVDNNGVYVKKGEIIYLHDGQAYLEKNGGKYFPVLYKELTKEAKAGESILINDGLIELKIISQNVRKTQLECEVINPGVISSRKGINAPQTKLGAPALTKKDFEDLRFISNMDIDFLALSFVRTPKDIILLKEECKKLQFCPQIIAKIERPEAIEHIEEITNLADGIMVARGDLGIEIPASHVPIAQRKIIATAIKHGRPVIIATQVLSSMTEHPRPTRAEVSDAANAVFEHADAIMLSNETAVGNYPVETVHTLNEVIIAIETELKSNKDLFKKPHTFNHLNLLDAITLNATELASDLGAKILIAVSKSGYTAKQIVKYRSQVPLIVYTNSPKTKRELTLTWGIKEVYTDTNIDPTNPTPFLREDLKKRKLAQKGDEIVVCNAGANNNERLITTFAV